MVNALTYNLTGLHPRIQTLCNDEYYGTSLDVIDPIKITQNVVNEV